MIKQEQIKALYNSEYERQIIGYYIHKGQDCTELTELDAHLEPHVFYTRDCKKYFEKIAELKAAGETFDMMRISTELDNESFFSFSFIAEAVKDCGSFNSIEYYAREIKNLYIQRESFLKVSELTNLITQKLSHEEKMITVAESLQEVSALMTSTNREMKTVDTAIHRVLDFVESRKNGDHQTGIKTGIAAIDDAMGERGIGKTDLIIVGARPKTGKTLVSLGVAANLAQENKRVLFFSLEMSDFELGVRLMSQASYMRPNDIYGDVSDENGEFWTNVSMSLNKLAKKNLYIEDKPALKVQQMRAIAKSLHAKLGGLDLIVVDYIQKAGINDKGRHDLSVGEISSGLKDLAKEIETPVLALSQLNRSGKGKPTVETLKESGQIEQDADAIFLLHNVCDTDEDAFKYPIVEVNLPAYRHGSAAGPFYLDKSGGRMRDASQAKVAEAMSAAKQEEAAVGFRPKGFKPQ